MLQHYLKIAFRQLLKNKVQYTLSILGIAIGLLCFSMFNYYLREVFDMHKAWPNHKRMAYFYIDNGKDQYQWGAPEAEVQQLVEYPVAGIEKIAYIRKGGFNLTFIRDNQEIFIRDRVAVINNDFIETFSLRTIDEKTPELFGNKILITQTYAKYLFGEEDPIGKEIRLGWGENLSSTYTISGILKEFPAQIQHSFEAMDLYILYEKTIHENLHLIETAPTILCSENVSPKEINQRLKGRFPIHSEKGKEIIIKPISEYNNAEGGRKIRAIVLLLSSLILISAMINFLKFSTQSFLSRTRELSLRKSLGSNNARLFALLFTEILIVLAFSMFASYFITKLFLWIYYNYLPPAIVSNTMIQVDEWKLFLQQAEYLFYLFVISTIVCLLALIRVKWTNIIVGINSAGRGKHGLRNFFLCFQLVICFFFVGISVATVVYHLDQKKYRNETLSKEECKRIWHIKFDQSWQEHGAEIISEIRSLNCVEDILLYTATSSKITLPDGRELDVKSIYSGENYDQFMNLSISGKMPRNENEVAVSRSLQQALEKEGNVESLKVWDEHYQMITGTYESLPFVLQELPLESEKNFSIIRCMSWDTNSEFYIKAITGQEKKAAEAILGIIQKHIPGFNKSLLTSMEEEHRLSFGSVKMMSDLLLLLSVVSLLVTCLGIYSAITLDTRGRRKEVAIRKINGAGKKETALLFGKLYIILLIISAAITLPIDYFVIEQMWEKSILNPLHWLLIVLTVSGIVFITVFWRIRQISLINPAETIKSE